MKKYSIALLVLGLAGCAEQKPAQVVYAKPSVIKSYTETIESKTLALGTTKSKNAKNNNELQWMWPATGAILSKFNPTNIQKKGIEISGREGSPVFAASEGVVAYSGNSLRGYGNLIIIKHQNNFITAYAHNRKNMVKEGDRVVIGQRIAEMGRSGTDKVKLHFEVRYHGKPIDPQGVLPIR